MDCSNPFSRLNESLLASALQFYFPLRNEPKPKTSLLDVDLFELKRAYNVPVDLDIRVEEDVKFTKDAERRSDEEELEEHLPIEFCESLIDEEEEEEEDRDIGSTRSEADEDRNVTTEASLYNCVHCVYKGSIPELREHYEQHRDCSRSTYWCAECKVDFENEAVFKLHKVREHVFYCSKCFYSFKTQRELLAHMTVHCRSKGYKCTICEKVFPIRRYFVRHLERHEKKNKEPERERGKSNEETFKCTQCEKQFVKKESLVKHLKIHSRDSLKCSLCDFTCGKKVTLKMHVISHEGNRKYKCDRCDFSFKQVGHLKRHIARFNH